MEKFTPTESIEQILEFLALTCGESVLENAIGSYLLSRDKCILTFCTLLSD